MSYVNIFEDYYDIMSESKFKNLVSECLNFYDLSFAMDRDAELRKMYNHFSSINCSHVIFKRDLVNTIIEGVLRYAAHQYIEEG